jgi:iron complex outermembrane receptor protein
MKRLGLLLICLCGLTASSFVRAEDAEEAIRNIGLMSLEELMTTTVTISTSTRQALSKAPSVVSVITAEDIRATGATNLTDILQGVPGVYLRINQFGYRPLVSLRGTASKNALIMVNGAPMRDLIWATGIFWKGLPAGMIERVEIIRGPGSALYGSDASSGVINVITKTAGTIRGSEAGIRVGSFDTRTAWLQHGQDWNGYDIGLTVEASTTDGHRPFIARDRLNQAGHAELGYDNLDLRLSVSRDHWRVMAEHVQKDNYGIGITGGSYLDPVTRAKDRLTSIAWLYSNRSIAADWGLDAEIRYRDLEYSSGNGFWDVPGTLLSQQRAAEQRFNAEASLVYAGFNGHELRFGGGYVWQDLYFVERIDNGVPTFFAPEQARRNSYVFLQDVWRLSERWELTAGARYDRFSDVGSTFNPRAALVWQTTDRLTAKLMVGRAFRAPSFLELYAQTGATTPNADLKPEVATTWDLSFAYQASRDLNLGVTVFDYLQKNPIVDAGGTFRNVEPHRIRGIELEAIWQASHTLRLSGNLTSRRVDDEQYTQLRVPDHFAIPRRDAYLRADWGFRPKWNLNLQANWTGKRAKALTDTRPALGSQTVVDTTVRYFHGSVWEFAAGIRNLFDADAREYAGTRIPEHLPLPRRNIYAEVRYKF